MFCSQCGTQVDDTARFCYRCGSPITQGPTPSNSYQTNYSQPAQPTSPQPPASNVKDRVNIVYPDGHSEIGDLYISASEIVFVKKSKTVLVAFGYVGNRMENGQEALRLQVSDIVSGQRTRIGLNRNVYQITLRDGNTYRLCLSHPGTITYLEGRFG